MSASDLFVTLLRAKLQSLPKSQRKIKPIRQARIYPFAIETEYKKYINSIMSVFSETVRVYVAARLPGWISERADYHADDFQTDFQELVNQLENKQADMFNTTGDGVNKDNKTYNYKTITATLTAIGFLVAKHDQKQNNKFFNFILGTDFTPFEPWLNTAVSAWVRNNYTLIKSLSGEYIKELNRIVYDSMESGKSRAEILYAIKKMDRNLTVNRARLIARDQVSKLAGQLTKKRNVDAGIDLYTWNTMDDKKVRKPAHKVLHRVLCRWDDDSVYWEPKLGYDDKGNRKWASRSSISGYIGIPGQDIQCRCYSTPFYNEVFKEAMEGIQ